MMGFLFSEKRVSTSKNSRDLHRTECPNDREGRDRIITELNARGHRVTSFYVTEDEEVGGQNVKPAPARPRRSR
jgi:predicted carbohydrate-binding protein with CBM5 and CBM33 domain